MLASWHAFAAVFQFTVPTSTDRNHPNHLRRRLLPAACHFRLNPYEFVLHPLVQDFPGTPDSASSVNSSAVGRGEILAITQVPGSASGGPDSGARRQLSIVGYQEVLEQEDWPRVRSVSSAG
jgi:hypothetical protein